MALGCRLPALGGRPGPWGPKKRSAGAECLAGVRSKGVSQTCPLCRAELPPGVAGLYELAMRAYQRVWGKVRRGEMTWASLDADSQEEMDECVAMLTEAVAQGHGGAIAQMMSIYAEGLGLAAPDVAKAGEMQQRLMALPGGEGYFQFGIVQYQFVARGVGQGLGTWSTLPANMQGVLTRVVQMLTIAADQHQHEGAASTLAEIYEGGFGVARDAARAAELRERVS